MMGFAALNPSYELYPSYEMLQLLHWSMDAMPPAKSAIPDVVSVELGNVT